MTIRFFTDVISRPTYFEEWFGFSATWRQLLGLLCGCESQLATSEKPSASDRPTPDLLVTVIVGYCMPYVSYFIHTK